jgi:hypothetical protein
MANLTHTGWTCYNVIAGMQCWLKFKLLPPTGSCFDSPLVTYLTRLTLTVAGIVKLYCIPFLYLFFCRKCLQLLNSIIPQNCQLRGLQAKYKQYILVRIIENPSCRSFFPNRNWNKQWLRGRSRCVVGSWTPESESHEQPEVSTTYCFT